MALTTTQVSELYVAIFNRASEGSGNAYWAAKSLTAAQIADQMLATTDAVAYFGGAETNQAFVERIYLNTLNKTTATDADGIAYWVGKLDAGTSRGAMVSNLVTAVASYATSTDAATIVAYNQFTNRVSVSDTTAATMTDAPTDYATSLAFGTTGLNVTDDVATVATANSAVSEIVTPTIGSTFALTAGTATTTGTALNDTINGVTSSLTSAKTFDTTDIIDGAAGTDTLNITMNASFTGMTGTGAVTNVENIHLINNSTVAKTFDATGITGATAYSVDATNAGVSISDMSAIAAVSVTGQASGTFSTAMDAAFVALAGTTDAMTFNVTNVGTADNAATTTNEESDVTATLTSMETINLNATGTNVLSLAGTATAINIAGSGSVKMDAISTTTTSFDASTSTGNITVDTTAAAANALTTVATGFGDDTITLDTADMLANGTIGAGDGTDILALTSGAKTVQYTMSGLETIALTAVTGAVTFSGANASGITTVSTVAANTAATSLVNMGAGDLTINAIGATVDAGDLSSTHTGATTLNYTTTAAELAAKVAVTAAADFTVTASTDLTVNVNAYMVTTGSVITAATATAVELNVVSGMSAAATPAEVTKFDGAITAAAATSFTANITGEIDDTAAITVDAATTASITNGATAGAMDLQAAALETLTLTSGKAFTFKAGSDLSAVQVAEITVNDGAFTGVDMAKISTLTIAGTGVTNATTGTTNSSFALINLGGNNAYNMNVTASGMKGGVVLGTVDVGAAQDISIDVSTVTGLATIGNIGADGVGTATGRNVTVTATSTTGAVDLSNVTATGLVTLTHSGASTFNVDTISAGSLTVNTGGIGAVTVGTGGTITTTGALSITNDSTGAFTATAMTAGVTGDVTVALDGTIGAVNLGTIAGKTVNLDVSNTIGGVATYGVITALNSATLALSELQANTIQIDTAAASTAFTAAITGGIAADAITINDVVTTTSIIVTGNLGTVTATDTLLVDADASTAATMNINISGITSYDAGTINVTGAAAAGTAQTIVGGAGADTITFETTDTLSSIDTVTGNAGTDILVITDAGALDADFTNVTTIETLTLGGASSVTLGTEATAAGIVTINGSAGADTINASAMTVALTIVGNGAGDTITGGTAVDTITVAAAGTDSITGGAGDDAIILTGAGAIDTIIFNYSNVGADIDTVSGYTLATDLSKISLAALETAGTSGVRSTAIDFVDLKDGTSAAVAGMVILNDAAAGGTDVTDGAELIVKFTGTFASTSILETALEAGGADALANVHVDVAAGDAFLVAWSDGAHAYLSVAVSTAGDNADGGFATGDLTITNLVQLTGLTSVTTGGFAGAAFLA